MNNEFESIINEENVVNDEFGEYPYYDTSSYNGYAKRKCLLDNQDFLPDQEVVDGKTHLADSISLVSATGISKVAPNGELALDIIPSPSVANVPTNAVWESSDDSVAYVVDGLLVAKQLGEVTITATDPENNITAEIQVKVVENPEKAQQEENTQEIIDELTESGGGTIEITAGTVAEIIVPDSITKTTKIYAPLAENVTYETESTKSVYINNTSETPSNIDITSKGTTVYLTGEFGTITSNTSIKVSSGSVDAVAIDEETAKNVTVNAIFNEDATVYNPTSNTVTISNGNTEQNVKLDINSPESTVNLNSKWDTVESTVGDNTLYVNTGAKIKKLVVKKGNVVVKDTEVGYHIDEVVNDTEYTVLPVETTVDTWAAFKSAAGDPGTTNLTADVTATNAYVLSGIASSGHAIWNLGENKVTCGTSSAGSAFLRGSINVSVYAEGEGGVYNNSNSYGFWVSGTTLNIYGGTYKAYTHVLYAEKGEINVYGGTFECLSEDKTFTLNCLDANYLAGTAKINVYGGKYYGFNPAESMSEPGGPVSFVAPGYKSVEIEEGVWDVVVDE